MQIIRLLRVSFMSLLFLSQISVFTGSFYIKYNRKSFALYNEEGQEILKTSFKKNIVSVHHNNDGSFVFVVFTDGTAVLRNIYSAFKTIEDIMFESKEKIVNWQFSNENDFFIVLHEHELSVIDLRRLDWGNKIKPRFSKGRRVQEGQVVNRTILKLDEATAKYKIIDCYFGPNNTYLIVKYLGGRIEIYNLIKQAKRVFCQDCVDFITLTRDGRYATIYYLLGKNKTRVYDLMKEEETASLLKKQEEQEQTAKVMQANIKTGGILVGYTITEEFFRKRVENAKKITKKRSRPAGKLILDLEAKKQKLTNIMKK